MTEQKTELPDAEVEELISSDPTPTVQPRTYKHSAAFRAKQNRYMRAYRTAKVEVQVKAEMEEQPPVFLEIFQDEPGHTADTLDGQLYSAMCFGNLLNEPMPQEGETYSQCFERIFNTWASRGYPLLVETEQEIALGPSRVISNVVLPIGSDAVIPRPWPSHFGLLQRLELMEAISDRVHQHSLNFKNDRWCWNASKSCLVPAQNFERPSPAVELSRYHAGFR